MLLFEPELFVSLAIHWENLHLNLLFDLMLRTIFHLRHLYNCLWTRKNFFHLEFQVLSGLIRVKFILLSTDTQIRAVKSYKFITSEQQKKSEHKAKDIIFLRFDGFLKSVRVRFIAFPLKYMLLDAIPFRWFPNLSTI